MDVRGNLRVRYKNETTTFDVRSVHPDHLFLEKTIVTEGRFLNELDPTHYDTARLKPGRWSIAGPL